MPGEQVGVRVEEENMKTGARHHCCSAYLTFVSVLARAGPDGRLARRMKRVVPTLPNHPEIFEAADRWCTAAIAHPLPLQAHPSAIIPSRCPSAHLLMWQ
jgi:hypothetical protein